MIARNKFLMIHSESKFNVLEIKNGGVRVPTSQDII